LLPKQREFSVWHNTDYPSFITLSYACGAPFLMKKIAQILNFSFVKSAELPLIRYYDSTLVEPVISVGGVEFDKRTRKLATALQQYPVHNRRLVLLLDAGINFLNILTSCLYAGFTVIPCAIPKNDNEKKRLQRILQDSQCVGMVIQQRDEQDLKDSFCDQHLLIYEKLMDEAECCEPIQAFGEFIDNVAVVQYSSGSTQFPKGVLVTEQMIINNHKEVEARWSLNSQTRSLSWLPHYHDMGLFGGILYPLMSSSWIMLLSPSEFVKHPRRWLKLISEFEITLTGGPPFAYELSTKYTPESLPQKLDLSRWNIAFCGADYVPNKVKQAFVEKFSVSGFKPESFFACYGLAEIALFAGGEPARGKKIAGPTPQTTSNGLLPCYLGENHPDIGIFDPESEQPVKDGEEGEICFCGQSITARYCSSEIPSFYYKQRWIRSGDIGFISNHWLTVTGRIKDIIKVRGKTIYPIDLAIFANQHYPELNQHAFLMDYDDSESDLSFSIESWKNKVSDNSRDIGENLKALFSDNFGIFVREIKVLERNHLPRTSSGKIKRWVKEEQNSQCN
jgi:acyl-CoA synthetase (AMP-forming)/AMP-acid ligase II